MAPINPRPSFIQQYLSFNSTTGSSRLPLSHYGCIR